MIVCQSSILPLKDAGVTSKLTAVKARVVYAAVLFISASNATAAEDVMSQLTKSDPMSSSYLLQLIMGLFVVILCIVALAWFAKKMNRFQSMTDSSLQIITGISLGTRDRAVLLQVGEDQILVGVSPGRLTTLHVLDKPVEIAANNTGRTVGTNFSDKLKVMMADVKKSSTSKQDI